MKMVICPRCNGEAEVFAFVSGPNGCSSGMQDCFTCKGNGRITESHAKQISDGKNLMRRRINAGMTLRDLAQRLKMTPAHLSAIEHGRQTFDYQAMLNRYWDLDLSLPEKDGNQPEPEKEGE